MTKHQRVVKTLAVVVLMAMLAVACGGGSDEAAADSDTTQPDLSADGEDAGGEPAPIATTAPIPLVSDDARGANRRCRANRCRRR